MDSSVDRRLLAPAAPVALARTAPPVLLLALVGLLLAAPGPARADATDAGLAPPFPGEVDPGRAPPREKVGDAPGPGAPAARGDEVTEDGEPADGDGDEDGDEGGSGSFAVLPIIGYSPDTELVLGLKARESDLAGWGTVVDLEVSYALQKQQSYAFSVEDEHLFDSMFSASLDVEYELDPSFEFFGLGADAPGPEESSNHLHQDVGGRLHLGVWLGDHLWLNFGAGYREVQVGRGRGEDSPDTAEAFPELRGLGGSEVRSLFASVIFDQQPGVTRRTDGLVVKGGFEEVGPSLDNPDWNYTRYHAETSYILDVYRGDYAIAARARAELVEGSADEIPFFALATLGGADSLRGFFPGRFRGRGSVLGNAELRGKLVGFDFFDIWDVVIAGVAFADAGRVFDSAHELRAEWDDPDGYELSYGGGIRFVLGTAIVARVDVGFSDEGDAQVYLRFGELF